MTSTSGSFHLPNSMAHPLSIRPSVTLIRHFEHLRLREQVSTQFESSVHLISIYKLPLVS